MLVICPNLYKYKIIGVLKKFFLHYISAFMLSQFVLCNLVLEVNKMYCFLV